MPAFIKACLSVVAALVACAFGYYEYVSGREHLMWVTLGVGAFMIAAMWIFPEAEPKEKGERR